MHVLEILLGGVVAAGLAAVIAGRMSRAIKISEFRQAWIDQLRIDTADYLGAAHLCFRKYVELWHVTDNKAARDRDEFQPLYNNAKVISSRIKMRINPRPDNPTKAEDDEFLRSLDALLNWKELNRDYPDGPWFELFDKAVAQTRDLLKREWDVTKKPWKWI